MYNQNVAFELVYRSIKFPLNPRHPPVASGSHGLEQGRAEVDVGVGATGAGGDDLGLPAARVGGVGEGDGRVAFGVVVGVGPVGHHRRGKGADHVGIGEGLAARTGPVRGAVVRDVARVGASGGGRGGGPVGASAPCR